MIGIYKILSPSGKVYIGQSVDIENRKSAYSLGNNNLKKQPKIFNSLKKYGVENHIFEIIEECNPNILDERETYWKQHYVDLLGWKKMLFCEMFDSGGGPKSEITKRKISQGLIGIRRSSETKLKISQALQGRIKTTTHKENITKSKLNISSKTKLKMSESITGKKLGKKSIGSGRKPGFKMSEEHKEKLRQAKIGKLSNNYK